MRLDVASRGRRLRPPKKKVAPSRPPKMREPRGEMEPPKSESEDVYKHGINSGVFPSPSKRKRKNRRTAGEPGVAL